MEERKSRLSSMVWRRFQQYFCVRLIPQNSMFANFCHVLNNYDTLLEGFKKKEAERQVKIMDAIRKYVTIKTAPYLSKEAIATLIANIEYYCCPIKLK